MNPSTSTEQAAWTAVNSRLNPASEGEFLEQELALLHLSVKRRWRVLGMFTAYKDGNVVSITELLGSQQFDGITLVGLVSTLLGQPGLHSQCLWYRSGKFEWYWARIEHLEKIERRADTHFRGGVPCIWLTTPVAEYAMTMPHAEYAREWETTWEFFNVAPIDAWPEHGYRPDWWPIESCGEWPYQRLVVEGDRIISPQDEIRQLTELLSAEEISSRATWHRSGPRGDHRFPGQPLHNLGHLLEWELAFDGGLKIPQDRFVNNKQDAASEEDEPVTRALNKKRKWVPRNWRSTRAKR